MSSSSNVETGIAQQVIQKRTRSTRKSTKRTAVVAADNGKNEGDNAHWAYEPPKDAVLLDHAVNVGEFEWDKIEDDDDTEIWLIRVPDSIKARHLDGLEIDPPSSSRTARAGGIIKKHIMYDIWSIGDDDAETAGGEEIKGLTCLLPRKREAGRLYIAPRHVSQCFVISAQPSIAITPEHRPAIYQNPPRPSHPKDVLKHSFVPYGARSTQSQLEDLSLDANDNEATIDKPADTVALPKDEAVKPKESKGKKRKVETDSPKKSKKHKANA